MGKVLLDSDVMMWEKGGPVVEVMVGNPWGEEGKRIWVLALGKQLRFLSLIMRHVSAGYV